MVDSIAVTARYALNRKASLFQDYIRARRVLEYNKTGDGRSQGMRDLFIKAGEIKVAKLEAEYPDFPEYYIKHEERMNHG